MAKLDEMLRSLLGMLVGVLAFLITLVFVLQVPTGLGGQIRSPAEGLGLSAFFAVLCAVIVEAATWQLRQARAMRPLQADTGDSNVYRQIGATLQYTDLVRSGVGLIVALLITVLAAYLVLRSPLIPSADLGVYLATLLLYLIVRRPLLANLGRLLSRGLSRYAVSATGVTIERLAGVSQRRLPVTIDFADIDEIRIFSPVEADAFERYELGPNVELIARQTRDLFEFARGTIPRPTVFTIGCQTPIGKIVLIRGPNLFYLTSFGQQDGSDLLSAFTAYRQQRAAQGT